MSEKISRRKFGLKTLGIGSGLLFFKGLKIHSKDKKSLPPLIITDHTNEAGKNAVTEGYNILKDGGSALDAVEKATNIIERDPTDHSVGLGGLPNEEGIVQLDSSIMDGKTYNAGAVACLENIIHPSSVARIVMEKTDHVLLVGKGALEFAKKWGFKEQNLLTDKARKIWLKWKTH